MKTKIAALLAGLLASLFLVACGTKEASSSEGTSSAPTEAASSASLPSSDVSSAPSSSAASNGTSGGAATLTPTNAAAQPPVEAEPSPTVIDGSYASLNEKRYTDERAPLLEISRDGSFMFRSNLADGRLGVITGDYVLNGDNLTLNILETDSTDYLGEDLTSLSFDVIDSNTLKYTGNPLGLTFNGSQFTGEGTIGTPPAEEVSREASGETQIDELPSETMEGLFISLNPDRYLDDRAPQLQLRKDRSFVFRSNLADGRLGTITGIYTLSGKKLTLTIESSDFDKYLGEDLETVSFTLESSTTLIYASSSVGLTNRGNSFTLDGAPVQEPIVEPELKPELSVASSSASTN